MISKLYTPVFAVAVADALIIVAVVVAGCTPTAPTVTASRPAMNSTGFQVTPALVQLTFDQPMNRTSVQQAISITPAVGTAPPAYAWSSDDRNLTITFPTAFAPNTAYTVTVGTGAKGGNDVAMAQPYVLTFTTGSAETVGTGPAKTPTTTTTPTPGSTTTTTPSTGTTGTTGTGTTTTTPSTGTTTGTGTGTTPGTGMGTVGTPPTTPPTPGTGGTPAPTLTFTKDILPLATARCKGCHGQQMTDYNNIINKKYVVPGKPDDSRYYLKPSAKIKHGGGHVWKDKAETVRQWIAAGAPK